MPTSSELRERLTELPRRRRSLKAWRAVRPGYELLGTRGARLHGGRWNPPGLAVLYTSLKPSVVRAEWTRMMERQGLPESAAYPLRLGQIAVRADVADLSAPGALAGLDVDEPLSILTPIAATRAIGDAASGLPLGALIVPSVTGAGRNLVILAEQLRTPPRLLQDLELDAGAAWPPG